jgi:membrane protein YdbS with pleckstrin-like domain
MKNPNLKKQQPKHLSINRAILTLLFATILIISLILFIFTPMELWIFGSLLLVIFTFYTLIYFYLGAAFKHFSYYKSETGLYIHQGVFWRKKIVVPLSRIQHTDVAQGPLARKYNLAELTVHTAGTRNASVKVNGIAHDDAESLRNQLCFDESKDSV